MADIENWGKLDELTDISFALLKCLNVKIDQARIIAGRELAAESEDESAGRSAAAIAEYDQRRTEYAKAHGTSERAAGEVILSRNSIKLFKYKVAIELRCNSEEEALDKCKRIAETAQSEVGLEAFEFSEVTLANAWLNLSRAEVFFDLGWYLQAISIITGVGLEAIMAMSLIASEAKGKRAAATAESRWIRLDPVKKWAFQERKNNPQGSRAAFIRDRLAEIKARAKEAGEPLSGDISSVTETVTGWFRKAGIQ